MAIRSIGHPRRSWTTCWEASLASMAPGSYTASPSPTAWSSLSARPSCAPGGPKPKRSIATSMSTASPETSLAIAIDIGGTFTDIALHDARNGRIWRAKTPSVPADPSQAFLTGVKLALGDAGYAATSLERVLHGTTVATNMILEGKGARAALVTTAGFRHVLTIGRQDIPRRANYLAWVKPARPVPASRVFEVKERIGAGGVVIEPLDEA